MTDTKTLAGEAAHAEQIFRKLADALVCAKPSDQVAISALMGLLWCVAEYFGMREREVIQHLRRYFATMRARNETPS